MIVIRESGTARQNPCDRSSATGRLLYFADSLLAFALLEEDGVRPRYAGHASDAAHGGCRLVRARGWPISRQSVGEVMIAS